MRGGNRRTADGQLQLFASWRAGETPTPRQLLRDSRNSIHTWAIQDVNTREDSTAASEGRDLQQSGLNTILTSV